MINNNKIDLAKVLAAHLKYKVDDDDTTDESLSLIEKVNAAYIKQHNSRAIINTVVNPANSVVNTTPAITQPAKPTIKVDVKPTLPNVREIPKMDLSFYDALKKRIDEEKAKVNVDESATAKYNDADIVRATNIIQDDKLQKNYLSNVEDCLELYEYDDTAIDKLNLAKKMIKKYNDDKNIKAEDVIPSIVETFALIGIQDNTTTKASSNIPIYKAEANIPGLADKVKANVITYASVIMPDKDNKVKAQQTKAGVKDKDLYYTKSILVTSNWNKNDDVFDRKECRAARHTPAHHPTNLEHNEKELVGHIVDNWVIDSNGNIIDDNSVIDDLPDIFHIVNGAVIYTLWDDEELQKRTEKLIAEIKDGNKYVSMQASFSNFDYAVIDLDGNYKIIERNESTAYLTKHLRAYGGKGMHGTYTKIGRLLRDITFTGKGYVDKPANPDSIIFESTA